MRGCRLDELRRRKLRTASRYARAPRDARRNASDRAATIAHHPSLVLPVRRPMLVLRYSPLPDPAMVNATTSPGNVPNTRTSSGSAGAKRAGSARQRRAFAQVKLRDLRGGQLWRAPHPGTVERVRLDERYEFLFLGKRSGDLHGQRQLRADPDRTRDDRRPADFLRDGMICSVMLYGVLCPGRRRAS